MGPTRPSPCVIDCPSAHSIIRGITNHGEQCPTMLYRLLKKVNQSSSTFCSFSPRSSYSFRQSSGLSDDIARALEASLPAKTEDTVLVNTLVSHSASAQVAQGIYVYSGFCSKLTVVGSRWPIGLIPRDIKDGSLNGYIRWLGLRCT